MRLWKILDIKGAPGSASWHHWSIANTIWISTLWCSTWSSGNKGELLHFCFHLFWITAAWIRLCLWHNWYTWFTLDNFFKKKWFSFFGVIVLIELSLAEKLQQIVINQFSRVAQHERCSFFGNVSLGSSISLSELRELYHVVKYLPWMCCFSGNSIFLLVFSFWIFSILAGIWTGCSCLWCWKW